jgi:hypothetical protein
MKKAKSINMLILLLILSLLLCPLAVNARFLADGKPSTEQKPHIKTLNGFKAQLWLIDDLSFFKNWKIPSDGVVLNPTNSAKKDKEIYAIIVFSNPGSNKDKLCNISCDMAVVNPDGTIYGEAKDQECWENKPAPPKDLLELGVFYLGIIIRSNEQTGRYKIQAAVNDKIKKTIIKLEQYFDVLE